jgi:hypothetical protein
MRTESLLRLRAADSRYGQRRTWGTAAGDSRSRPVRQERRKDRDLFIVMVGPQLLCISSFETCAFGGTRSAKILT